MTDIPEDDDEAPTAMPVVCGRCYDEVDELFDANCAEQPHLKIHLGMYHCPDCGAMVLGGFTHPTLCRPCLFRSHPYFDAEGPTDER